MTTDPSRSAVEATATGKAVAPSEDASAMIAVMRMEDVLPHFGRTQIADMLAAQAARIKALEGQSESWKALAATESAERTALLARAESAEAERDAGDVVRKSLVALFEAQDARIKTAEHKSQCALDSHEGQVRNTLAFKKERDQLRAELAALRAEVKAVVGGITSVFDDADKFGPRPDLVEKRLRAARALLAKLGE